jgi:hypothetical protein
LIWIIALPPARPEKRIMAKTDLFYFLHRAEEELELARLSAHERAGRAHALLAGYYFDRFYSGGREEPANDQPPLTA